MPSTVAWTLSLATSDWVYEVLPHAIVVLFAFSLGACLGSFANVLVVRLPLGMSVIAPPSRCPRCGVRLRWHDNLPIVGWIALRGRCRACGVPISPQYLLLEIVCGLMLVWIYLAHFATPPHDPWWMHLGGPWWYRNGPLRALPAALIEATLFIGLLAMSKIDARAFIIPMALPVAVTVVAFLLWPVQALMPMAHGLESHWPIERLGWPGTMASFGGAAGLLIAGLGLRLGLVRRSYLDYEDFLSAQQPGAQPNAQPNFQQATNAPAQASSEGESAATARDLPIEIQFLAPLAASVAVGLWINEQRGVAIIFGAVAILTLIAPVLALRGPGPVAEEAPLADYPHARRETWREVLFLAPCLVGLLAGWMLGESWASDAGPGGVPTGWPAGVPAGVPVGGPAGVWAAMGTALAGFLVGGGIVWGVRIIATLILGREAMGMGDVHLLAAVGAAAGPLAAGAAFFIAPFLGLAWVAAALLLGGRGALQQGGLPFGPHLALGAVAAVAFRPALGPLWDSIRDAVAVLGGAGQ